MKAKAWGGNSSPAYINGRPVVKVKTNTKIK
jgi:hypothetical protein